MDTGRNAHVVAAHVEGLRELQTLRAAMEDDDQPFDRQFSTVFDAAVDFSLAAIPLRALLLTDHELAMAHRRVAATTGLGPQVPVLEMADWLERQCRRGRIDPSVDARAAALNACGSADYLATLHLVLDEDTATTAPRPPGPRRAPPAAEPGRIGGPGNRRRLTVSRARAAGPPPGRSPSPRRRTPARPRARR